MMYSMKKLFLFFSIVLCAVSVCAADCQDGPYGLLINGSTKVEASAWGDSDFEGRKQYKASCVKLSEGDVIKLINLSCDDTWSVDLDPYGEYQKFSGGKSSGQITCTTAGSYDFYIKLSMEKGDVLYIGPGENCSSGSDDDDSGKKEDDDDSGKKDDDDDSGKKDDDTPKDYTSSVPSQCTDVMLQAFYWDSNADKKHGNTRWTTLQSQASEIAAYFDLVWLPPSAKSSGGVGYLPSQYCNQNSAWGARDELETLISTLHAGGSKVIADIVINHSNNKSTWCDYYEEDFGEYGKFYPDASWICRTDEMNSNKSAGTCYGKATGSADDGYGDEANYADARDWDHNNAQVREMCRAYLKWLKAEMKYDGWRYDYCKGFHNSHVNDYNSAAKNYFSVMEYWDGNAATLWSRIQDAGCNTLTFDFATKYTAFNNSIAANNYSGCKGSGLLGAGHSKYAVTFVDSHDTYQRDNNEFGGKGNSMTSALKARLLQCNAFMLSMPGVPCVFYPHWKEYKSEIAPMVLARKAVGVHSESSVSDEADASGYRAAVSGKNGTLVLELGNRVSTTKSGYTKAAHGTGYAMWIKTTTAVAPKLLVSPASSTFKTESLTITMSAVGGTETAQIYYTTDETDPRTSATRIQYTAPVTITATTVIKAYLLTASTQSSVYTYEYVKKEPQTTPIIVSFLKPDSWTKIYLYSWTTSGTKTTEHTGKYPGTELTVTNANGYHYHQFDATLREVNFIFNAGSGKEQTSDLWTDEDVCYSWSSGAEKKEADCATPMAVEQVRTEDIPALDLTLPMYNVLGIPVDARYHGIVIQQGHAYLLP